MCEANAENAIETVSRMLTVDVRPAKRELYQPALDAVRFYRAACAKCAATAVLLDRATMDVLPGKLKLSRERARAMQAELYGLNSRAKPSLRSAVKGLLPADWDSSMADSLLRDVDSVLNSKDQRRNCRRRTIAASGSRGAPAFDRRGLNCRNRLVEVIDHGVRLSWSKALGAVEFLTGTMDPGRWAVWRKLVSGEYKVGAAYLNERDGDLRLGISYSHPVEKAPDLDPGRVLEIAHDDSMPGKFLSVRLVEGERTFTDLVAHNELNALAALDKIDEFAARDEKLKGLRAACGSKRGGSGLGSAAEHYDEVRHRLSRQREKVIENWNHTWTRQLVVLALRQRAGTVRLMDWPAGTLFARPWQCSQFASFLGYKCCERSIALKVEKSPKVEIGAAAGQ